MTTSPPPAAPRTQEIPVTGESAHAVQHGEDATAVPVTAPATVPPSALPAPAYPVTSPQPVTTADQAHAPHEQQAPHEQAAPLQGAHASRSAPQPTGPLDSLLGPPPVPAPAARQERPEQTRAPRAPRDRVALVAAGLAALGLVLLEVGLLLRPEGSALWSDVPAWSAFATLCAVLGGLAAAVRLVPALRLRPAGAERIALGGLTGLAVFWALVVLPRADTDRGFVLTMALAAVAAAVWLVPGRRR